MALWLLHWNRVGVGFLSWPRLVAHSPIASLVGTRYTPRSTLNPLFWFTRPARPAARERQSAVERSIREEARRLRQGQAGGEAGGQGAAAAGRKNVDLDSLAFAQGAHFNSSKQCTLPQVRAVSGARHGQSPAGGLSRTAAIAVRRGGASQCLRR